MRLRLATMLLLALWGLAAPASAEDYRLNAGDVVRISVWREPDLQRELPIAPDGTLSFPLAGQLSAVGKSSAALEAELVQKLERFIPGPVVTVELVEAAGNIVYVIGEVNQPGVFPLTRPTSVLQMLSVANGFTPYAGKGRIKILRRSADGEQAIPFDYRDAIEGTTPQADFLLQAGDTIVVPGGALF